MNYANIQQDKVSPADLDYFRLDLAVAIAVGITVDCAQYYDQDADAYVCGSVYCEDREWSPSSYWQDAGPLLEAHHKHCVFKGCLKTFCRELVILKLGNTPIDFVKAVEVMRAKNWEKTQRQLT